MHGDEDDDGKDGEEWREWRRDGEYNVRMRRRWVCQVTSSEI